MKIAILYDVAEEDERVEQQRRDGASEALMHEVLRPILDGLGHETSLLSARSVRELGQLLHDDESDLIFNICEGFCGAGDKEPHVAALMELCGKRFTGAGSPGLSLAGDKALAKKLLNFHGINTPRFSVVEAGTVDHADDLSFPMFVKPSNSDASIGIDEHSVVQNFKELMERISYIHTEIQAPALIEEFIDGREIYVSVLQNNQKLEALPVVEWDFSNVPLDTPHIASAEAKWDGASERFKGAKESVVTDLPECVDRALKETAIEAFRALRLRDYGRVDMRLRKGTPDPHVDLTSIKNEAVRNAAAEGWEVFVIEVNPNAHLATDSELPLAAAAAGLSYPQLIARIVENAMGR